MVEGHCGKWIVRMHLDHRPAAVDAISPCGAGFFCCCCCLCAFLPLLLLPPLLSPASPAILQCPLSNGIKWSTKCAQGVTTMRWGWVNRKGTSGCWAFRASSVSWGGREGAGEELFKIELLSTAQAKCSSRGSCCIERSPHHSIPCLGSLLPCVGRAKQVLPRRSPCPCC